MPRVSKKNTKKVKKSDNKVKPARLKKINHKPWFVYGYRENVKYPEVDYQLAFTYSFDKDRYRCDVEVFQDKHCDVIFGENTPFIKHLYKCRGVAQQFVVYSFNELGDCTKYITFIITFYDDYFDHCFKVIYFKFQGREYSSGDNRNSRYIIFSVNNMKPINTKEEQNNA